MSVKTPRKRTVFTALTLVFVIAWTYAHIAYAWPWNRFQTGTRITCQGQYSVESIPNTPALPLGVLSGGSPYSSAPGAGSTWGSRPPASAYPQKLTAR